MKCPECGSLLRTKKGKYGEFIGCSNFPKCTYTRPTDETIALRKKIKGMVVCGDGKGN